MKKMIMTLYTVTVFLALPSYAQYSADPEPTPSSESDETATYIKNLATYFGYNIVDPAESPFVSVLLDNTFNIYSQGKQFLDVFFGARPVNYPNFSDFTTNTNYDSFNAQANILYKDSYGTPATDDATGVSVVKNFDQQTYQSNPVNQAIINILSSVNPSDCPTGQDNCLNQNDVLNTMLKDVQTDNTYLPSENDFYRPDVINKYANQLNVDTLLGPLVYSQKQVQKSPEGGIPIATQEQLAMNYVRYATNDIPVDALPKTDYANLWSLASTKIESSTSSEDATNIRNAQKKLATYLARQRLFTAQNSLPLSNFYQSMAARMPQKMSNGSSSSSSSTTSEALNDFVMATWRLYSPAIAAASEGEQWVEQINKASAATTQKENAILLSEINYQLYQTRLLLERLLLTNSLIALQATAGNAPTLLPE